MIRLGQTQMVARVKATIDWETYSFFSAFRFINCFVNCTIRLSLRLETLSTVEYLRRFHHVTLVAVPFLTTRFDSGRLQPMR